MSEALFTVSDEVFEAFPDYIVGWIVASVPSNHGPNKAIEALLRDAEQRATVVYAGRDLKAEPSIAVWRKAFSSLGWSASKFPPSVEALTKRVARGATLPSINPAVDLGNCTALTYLVPAGCHDLERSPGLTVRMSRSEDTFLPMGDGEPETPAPGEVVYASGQSVRTRRWVWRQSRDALVGEDATSLFFPVDGFSGVSDAAVDAGPVFLGEMLPPPLGAPLSRGLVTRDEPRVTTEHLQVQQ